MNISQVLISDDLIKFLEDRRLDAQYKKARKYILSGNAQQSQLKIRQPKNLNIYYFRLNKQFRTLCKMKEGTLCKMKEGTLYIYDIDNHQN